VSFEAPISGDLPAVVIVQRADYGAILAAGRVSAP